MQSLPSEVQIGAAQDQGDRKEQQDYFAVTEPRMGFLAVLADGMGGHPGSGNASVIAVNTFVKRYNEEIAKNTNIQKALDHALTAANQAVFEANQRINADMGTTLVAGVVQGKRFYWLSVGDSSLYLYTKGKLTKINKTHSYGAEIQAKIEAGVLTWEQASLDPKKRNMLTSYLGLKEIPKIDFSEYQLELGNKILLCSDGLDNALSEAEIEDCLRREMMSQEKCDKLMATALGKKRPNQDNITVVLLELEPKTGTTITPSGMGVTELRGKTGPSRRSWVNKWFIPISLVLLLLVLLVGGGIFVYKEKIYSWWNKTASEEEPESSIIDEQNGSENYTGPSGDATGNEQSGNNNIPNSNGKTNKIEPSSETHPTKKCNNGLRLGDIQQVLEKAEYYHDELDGNWGTNTKDAVEQYQRYKGINPPTGYLNPKTCDSLLVDYEELLKSLVPPHTTDQPF
jgi:serine/threonine protein phosphatase PrpC